MQQIDHRLPRCAFGQHRLHLPGIGAADAKIGIQDDHQFRIQRPRARASINGIKKSTGGTGAFLLLHTGKKCILSHSGLLTTVAYRINNEIAYGMEGSIFNAGTANIKYTETKATFFDKNYTNKQEWTDISFSGNRSIYHFSVETGPVSFLFRLYPQLVSSILKTLYVYNDGE